MVFLIGLLFVISSISIAAFRTRPAWWMTITSTLAVVGILHSILALTGVIDTWGETVDAWISWPYLVLTTLTLLASVFVLELRGPNGEEAAPLIGDNPFDGDTDDSDDPTPIEGFDPLEPDTKA